MFLVAKKLYDKANLNPSIIYSILTRLVQSAVGILILVLITRFLDKNEQGYYYTFTSFIAIQILFELGLTGIITQYIAHEVAHLTWINNYQLTGNAYNQSRLAYILHLSVKWFLVLGIILFLVLYFSGNMFFSNYNNTLNIDWKTPWFLLSISTTFILFTNFILAVIEGLGKVEEANKIRFLHQLLNLLLLVILFAFNFKLLSSGIAYLISNFITGIILFVGFRKIFQNIWITEVKWKVNFKEEIFPYLFRIGLGNISGYFIYQLINPVLFATQGPVLAGQMGATQTFLNGILIVSLSWFSTKVSIFSNLVAKGNFAQLNLVYRKNLHISLVVCLLGILSIIFFISVLKTTLPTIGNRFLEITPIIFLALTQISSLIGNAQAYYLRSFKKEPFFIPSIVIGILSGTFTVLCSKYYGITVMAIVYFFINGFIGFIWAWVIFRRKTFEWTNTRLYI